MVINNEILFASVIEMLSDGKKVTIPVKGYSMLPFIIGERDLVELEKIDGTVAPDDIVLFSIGGRYILHRVREVNGENVLIQGDGVLVNQERCKIENIHGRVIKILKKGKREVDPYSPWMLKKVHFWNSLGMLRRYPLAILRRLPGIKSKSI